MQQSALEGLIRVIPDFPIPGILFRDITPLLADRAAFAAVVDMMSRAFADREISHVAAIEARGYIIGAPIAYKLGAGFIPVRKPGKLPFETISAEYALEYGVNTLEMHNDAVRSGDRVLLIDDLLATGGTAAATRSLLEQLGATVVAAAFLVELEALDGRAKLPGIDVKSFIRY